MTKASKKLIVIGGGAAGFFCAVNAARLCPSLRVTIIEKSGKLLSKVKVSGRGRCNVTHACFDISEMSKQYPRGKNFVKKTFHQFFTSDTIKWFEERDIILKTEEDGRMFPVSDSSQSIIDCLLNEASSYRVEVMINSEVKSVSNSEGKFRLEMQGGETITSDFICIACGGYPKSEMFEWLKQTGHSISSPVPSLFTFNLAQVHNTRQKDPITSLMGVSAELVKIKIEGSKLSSEGPILITHWGLSGPAVLRLSAWGAREFNEKNYSFKAHLNWTPAINEIGLKADLQRLRFLSPTKKLVNQNITALPNRLFHFILNEAGIDKDLKFADLTAKAENALIRNLVDYVVEVKGKTTFKEEFVTAGGINLSEVDANSMMSRIVPGLFFAGEVLDVDGITGGFNFQHAWTSGFIAAKAISNRQ